MALSSLCSHRVNHEAFHGMVNYIAFDILYDMNIFCATAKDERKRNISSGKSES